MRTQREREIRTEIRELKARMKAAGMKVTCFMNRQDVAQSRCNGQLFRLKLELEDELKKKGTDNGIDNSLLAPT